MVAVLTERKMVERTEGTDQGLTKKFLPQKIPGVKHIWHKTVESYIRSDTRKGPSQREMG
jgi:hypothetical protein